MNITRRNGRYVCRYQGHVVIAPLFTVAITRMLELIAVPYSLENRS